MNPVLGAAALGGSARRVTTALFNVVVLALMMAMSVPERVALLMRA